MAANRQSDLYNELRPLLLQPIQQVGAATMSRCPCHDDARGKPGRKPRPSLALYQTGAIKCFAGCDTKDIIAALRARDQRPRGAPATVTKAPKNDRSPLGAPVSIYDYGIAQKARFETPNKTFRFRRSPDQPWGGLDGLLESELPLYHAEEIRAAQLGTPIIFCEGEKAADAARKHGWITTCNIGGASQVDFGISLDVLQGRPVWLWADNDPPGVALMARVGVMLRRTAAAVRLIDVPLPYKGDAADFFAANGTNDQIREGVRDRESVKWIAEDAITISLPSAVGLVIFAFTDIERRAAFEFELQVSVDGHPWDYGPKHLNMSSVSAEDTFRRGLSAALPVKFDKDAGENWAQFVNIAFNRLREAYAERAKLVWALDMEPVSEQRYIIEDLIPEGRPTVFYGDGGASKTYLLLRMALAVAMGEDFCGLRTLRSPVIFADWEDVERTFNFRVRRLYAGLGFELDSVPVQIGRWPGRDGGPLHEQARELRRVIEETRCRLLIIDAAGIASGSEPDKAETALRFYNAIGRLGPDVTVVIIAHVTKAAAETGGRTRIKGAAEWSNEAGMAWQVTSNAKAEDSEFDVKLECTKANGPWPRPRAFHVRHDGKNGAVTFTQIEPTTVPDFVTSLPPRQRIRALLDELGQANTNEIAEALNLPPTRVRKELNSDTRTFVQIGHGGPGNPATWGIRSARSLGLGSE